MTPNRTCQKRHVLWLGIRLYGCTVLTKGRRPVVLTKGRRPLLYDGSTAEHTARHAEKNSRSMSLVRMLSPVATSKPGAAGGAAPPAAEHLDEKEVQLEQELGELRADSSAG